MDDTKKQAEPVDPSTAGFSGSTNEPQVDQPQADPPAAPVPKTPPPEPPKPAGKKNEAEDKDDYAAPPRGRR